MEACVVPRRVLFVGRQGQCRRIEETKKNGRLEAKAETLSKQFLQRGAVSARIESMSVPAAASNGEGSELFG